MTQRKWLKECHAWLDDPESVQYKSDGDLWVTANGAFNPVNNHEHLLWRIKPKTITINGCEFVLSETITEYELQVSTNGDDAVCHFVYFNTREDRDAVYNKLVEVLGS